MNTSNHYLSKRSRELCDNARSLCRQLELRSDAICAALERFFAPFLEGHDLEAGVRRLSLVAINAIREQITRLLDADREVHDLSTQLTQARQDRAEMQAEMQHYVTSVKDLLQAVCRLPDTPENISCAPGTPKTSSDG